MPDLLFRSTVHVRAAHLLDSGPRLARLNRRPGGPPRSWPNRTRRLLAGPFVAALALFVALSVIGCHRASPPSLITVSGVSPSEAEVGDRVELQGQGFPQGKTARVTFRGNVYRAGQPPRAIDDVVADGSVTAGDRLEVAATEGFVATFCGSSEQARHATFRGQIEVAFRSSALDMPPLVGAVADVVWDVRPSSVRQSVQDAREKHGVAILTRAGIEVAAPSEYGLPISTVRPASIAARAGLRAGDVVTEIDGVRALAVEDVAPRSARSMEIGVRHQDGTRVHKVLALGGTSFADLALDYAWALGLVGLAVGLLVLLSVPPPRFVRAFDLRLAEHVRARAVLELVRTLLGPRRTVAVLAFVSLLLGTFALGPYVVAPDLDLALWIAASLVALAVGRVRGAPTPFAGLGRLAAVFVGALIVCASAFGMVVLQGVIAPAEFSRAQGGAPWQMCGFEKPAALAFAFAYVGALVWMFRARRGESVLDLTHTEAPHAGVGSTGCAMHISSLERVSLVLASSLAVVLFFGGWQLPGVAGEPTGALRSAGAFLFVTKTLALYLFVMARSTLGAPLSNRQARAVVVMKLLPALAAGVAIVGLARHVAARPWLGPVWTMMLAVVATFLVFRLLLRVHSVVIRPVPHASPFL